MSGRRSSVSDYPEHLNPFHDGGDKWHFWGKIKRSGSFSNSLKDLRSTMTLRSFRGHKKPKYEKEGDVQLRNHTYNGYSTVSRQTLPVYQPAHIVTSTPLLPRSRFNERVRKSVDSSYDSSKNPFENGDDEGDVNEIKNEDYRKRVRRRKRRAPLPPGVKDSSWSLTSVETDISSYPHSEVSDLDVSEIEKPMAEICEMLQSFTKEIEKMTDSFNGNDGDNHKSGEPESDETHNRSSKEDTPDNENIVCPKIIITSAEFSPTKDDILIVESVSCTSQDEDYGIEQKPPKEYPKGDDVGCEKLRESSQNNNNNSRIGENIVNGTETGCDHEILEEEPPPSSSDHEIIQEKSPTPHHHQEIIKENIVGQEQSSLHSDHEIINDPSPSSHYDQKITEEKLVRQEASSLHNDHEIINDPSPSSHYDQKIIEEKLVGQEASSLHSDHEIINDQSPSLHYDQKIIEENKIDKGSSSSHHDDEIKKDKYSHEVIERQPSSSSCNLKKVEEIPSSSGCDDTIIVEEEEVEERVDNERYLNNNDSEGLGVNHFSRYAHDMKYIDESYTIHDRVMDDSDIRNDNSQKTDETNNNKEYVSNGSYKENKFPVEESDFANGNGTNINKNVIEEKEIQEQPPVPKVRKKKFTKAKLLGFFSGK